MFFTPKSLSSVSNIQGINWSNANMSIKLRSGCGNKQPDSIEFVHDPKKSIPKITTIGIVSSLACSTNIPNDTEILEVQLTDRNGKVATQKLQVGRDTSEWAYDCSDVLPAMRHSRSLIFDSFPVERDGLPKCQGHSYVTLLPIDKLSNIQTIEFKWLGKSGGIDIQKISIIDEESKQSYPITKDNFNDLEDTEHWQYIEDINHKAHVYENLRAMPRAWLVPEVITLNPEQVVSTIKSSKLPDGRSYDPSKIALVEKELDFKIKKIDLAATTKFVKLNDAHIQVKTNSQYPAFLIISDTNYPGWKAQIDGKNTQFFQTDYVLRGVLIPEGEHLVEFNFQPKSFHLGIGISSAILVLFGYLFFKEYQQKFINNN